MSISSVSFSGINTVDNVRFRTGGKKSYSRRDIPETQKIQSSGAKTPSRLKKAAAAASIALGTILAYHQLKPINPARMPEPPAAETAVSFQNSGSPDSMARNIGLYKNAVYPLNGSESEKDFEEVQDVNISAAFDYLSRKIDDLKLNINAMPDFSPEKFKKENLMFAYGLKHEEQPKIADAFLDEDGMLTFKLHLNGNSVFEKNGEIGIEDFKKLYDIKDGALKDNNEFLKDKGRGTQIRTKLNKKNNKEHFYDYTNTKLKDGDILKVPISAIDTENINIDDFYSESFWKN